MKKGLSLFAIVTCFVACIQGYSQTGESKFKMVIVNLIEKKISPSYRSYNIVNQSFSDVNMRPQLYNNEDGTIRFYIKNTGTILLQELKVGLNLPHSVPGITYGKDQTISQIKRGDSTLVVIPVSSDENLKDGNVKFEIHVTDSISDSIRTAVVIIPTSVSKKEPFFTWESPRSYIDSVDFSVVKITGLVKSSSKISRLRVYINDQVPDDDKSFEVLPTDNLNEFRIARTLFLNEGINEIKIEVRNDAGVAFSDSRIINYSNQKIDNTYAERRLALVIGNADYKSGNALRNPINDAEAITEALKNVGFTVLQYLNADLKTMKKAMDTFGEKLQEYNVGLFYYAGHGMQVKGNNYLIPIDANLKIEQDVDYDCVDAGRLLGKMDAAGSKTNIVILDACRDNPFARSWEARSVKKGEAGLAFMNAPSGTIIAYATSPGKISADGTGRNGIYTEAILKFIKMPGIPIEDFFKAVRVEVANKTNKAQTPWESTSLTGKFYFKIK